MNGSELYDDLPTPTSLASTLPPLIHALLTTLKTLLASLQAWSSHSLSENAVSDVYVTAGTRFNEVVRVFAGLGVPTAGLTPVIDELRAVLEGCLAEEPSAEVLAVWMPRARKVVYKLLIGLDERRDAWKRAVERGM